MKINLYMEGGAGDHILAHRFAVKIREKYPIAGLHVYSDTENNKLQTNILRYLYYGFYDAFHVISHKKYKKCIVNSQFGEEEYRGGIHNVPDNILEDMTKNCDLFYNLHLDSLEFLNHDYNWQENFDVIPKPRIVSENKWEKHLCFHLISGSSKTHLLEDFYIRRLILDSSQIFKDYIIYLIATEEQNEIYKDSLGDLPENVKLFNDNIYNVCDLILTSSGGIYIDSALRLLSRSMNLPTIDLSKDCNGYSGVPYSHRLRWLLWPNSTFGLNYNTNDIIKMLKGMLEIKLFLHMPELSLHLTNDQVSNTLIKRVYSINQEKSILA